MYGYVERDWNWEEEVLSDGKNGDSDEEKGGGECMCRDCNCSDLKSGKREREREESSEKTEVKVNDDLGPALGHWRWATERDKPYG